ncbi:MAG: UPF0158 family protein [Candidatus Helarchaeota archaeon]
MKKKVKIIVDIYELMEAFEDNSGSFNYYVDTVTGKVVMLANEFIDDDFDEPDKKRMKIENEYGDRYIETPIIPSYEAYNDMQDFIETINDKNIQETLYIAIDGPGAFRRFKNVLLNHPDEQQKWFEFKKGKTLERIKNWLKEEEIFIIGSGTTEI